MYEPLWICSLDLSPQILNPLVSKAQLSQTVQSRLVSCKILGKLTNKFDAHTWVSALTFCLLHYIKLIKVTNNYIRFVLFHTAYKFSCFNFIEFLEVYLFRCVSSWSHGFSKSVRLTFLLFPILVSPVTYPVQCWD